MNESKLEIKKKFNMNPAAWRVIMVEYEELEHPLRKQNMPSGMKFIR